MSSSEPTVVQSPMFELNVHSNNERSQLFTPVNWGLYEYGNIFLRHILPCFVVSMLIVLFDLCSKILRGTVQHLQETQIQATISDLLQGLVRFFLEWATFAFAVVG